VSFKQNKPKLFLFMKQRRLSGRKQASCSQKVCHLPKKK